MYSPSPSIRTLRGLDWTNFFLSDIRTGVGPFIAVYLTNMHWNVAQIGVALTVAEVAGLLTQAPAGAVIDYLHSKRAAMVMAVGILSASALLLALVPTLPVVFAAQAALGMKAVSSLQALTRLPWAWSVTPASGRGLAGTPASVR